MEPKGTIKIIDQEGTVEIYCKKLDITDETMKITIDENKLATFKKIVFKIGKKTITYNQVS